ncbi:MAG: c-type cytochrome [Gammaproteobacteria bacterium]
MRWLLVTGLMYLASVAAQADGDAKRGEMLFASRCAACHSLDANRVGPALAGVVGRRAGTAPDYAYSDAVRAASVSWSEAAIDAWLSNPENLIPGQKMGYSVPDAQDRADVISFLKSQHDRQ